MLYALSSFIYLCFRFAIRLERLHNRILSRKLPGCQRHVPERWELQLEIVRFIWRVHGKVWRVTGYASHSAQDRRGLRQRTWRHDHPRRRLGHSAVDKGPRHARLSCCLAPLFVRNWIFPIFIAFCLPSSPSFPLKSSFFTALSKQNPKIYYLFFSCFTENLLLRLVGFYWHFMSKGLTIFSLNFVF